MRLRAENLSVSLSGRSVVREASLTLHQGEVVGLIGPNGAGKSTLLRALCGLVPYQGHVFLDDRDQSSLSVRERARRVAHLPQARTIGWPITVTSLVALGRHPWDGTAQTNAEICGRAMALMDVLDLRDRIATELSGGEQARVLAARAVAQDTPVLLADEPVSGLDPAHQIIMMQAFRQRAAEGRAIMISLHDLTLSARWCDRIVMLSQGAIVADGPPGDVLTADRLGDVFGIRTFVSDHEGRLVLSPVGLARSGGAH